MDSQESTSIRQLRKFNGVKFEFKPNNSNRQRIFGLGINYFKEYVCILNMLQHIPESFKEKFEKWYADNTKDKKVIIVVEKKNGHWSIATSKAQPGYHKFLITGIVKTLYACKEELYYSDKAKRNSAKKNVMRDNGTKKNYVYDESKKSGENDEYIKEIIDSLPDEYKHFEIPVPCENKYTHIYSTEISDSDLELFSKIIEEDKDVYNKLIAFFTGLRITNPKLGLVDFLFDEKFSKIDSSGNKYSAPISFDITVLDKSFREICNKLDFIIQCVWNYSIHDKYPLSIKLSFGKDKTGRELFMDNQKLFEEVDFENCPIFEDTENAGKFNPNISMLWKHLLHSIGSHGIKHLHNADIFKDFVMTIVDTFQLESEKTADILKSEQKNIKNCIKRMYIGSLNVKFNSRSEHQPYFEFFTMSKDSINFVKTNAKLNMSVTRFIDSINTENTDSFNIKKIKKFVKQEWNAKFFKNPPRFENIFENIKTLSKFYDSLNPDVRFSDILKEKKKA